LKVIGYATVALVVTLSAITYQIGHSIMMSADEKALKVFQGDANSETMTAFVNFISESGRNYKDETETARRYRNFKANHAIVQRTKIH